MRLLKHFYQLHFKSLSLALVAGSAFVASTNVQANIAIKDFVFNKGETVNLCFIDANLVSQKLVKDIANTWLKYANINFNFLSSSCAQVPSEKRRNLVRIKFDMAIGNASYDGKYVNEIPFPEPTMWLKVKPEYIEIPASLKGQILHEFGHVLGLEHEHFHPSIQKKINNDTIKTCQEVQNWSEETCRYNLIPVFSTSEMIIEDFDKDSVMMYNLSYYSSSFADYMRKSVLSAKDISFIQKLYPQ